MKHDSLPKGMAAVVTMAVVAGFTYNAFSPSGVPLIRTAPVKVAVADSAIFGAPAAHPGLAAADTSAPGAFRVITLDQMKRAVGEKKGMLFDARTPDEYAAGHIPGAANLYAMAPESWVDRIAEVPRDTLVLIYCSNPHCPFGKTLAEFLGSFGFTNMLLFDEGWDAWTGAGLPTASGDGGDRP
jgi:rhodanese-related sulfurtransferase